MQILLVFLIACSICSSGATDSRISFDVNDIDYILYTLGNDPFKFKIDVDPQDLISHGFDARHPTKIVAHGWGVDGDFYLGIFADAYKNTNSQFNMIGIDWDKLATFDAYYFAATNSKKVGEHVGENLVVAIILDQLGQSPSLIHANGHSLGAHLVGVLGRTVQQMVGSKIDRITGLDPAKPYFDMVSEEWSIQATDAEMVDIIHTNSGTLLEGAVSIPEPIGQVDFYPNGGSHQAGCTDICIGNACLDIDLIDLFFGACSHNRAWELYVESIENPDSSFLSTPCASYNDYLSGYCNENQQVPMGEGFHWKKIMTETSSSPRLLFLQTNKEEPFSIS